MVQQSRNPTVLVSYKEGDDTKVSELGYQREWISLLNTSLCISPSMTLVSPGDLFRYLASANPFEVVTFLTATRCLKSSDRPCAFGADLLNDRIGSEIG